MKSGWVDREAQAAIEHYADRGIGPDLALRVYTTRLLGRDPKLVLHGGGNTSVKTDDGGPARRGGRGALRQRLGLRHGGDRAGRTSGGAARSPAQAARARHARRRGHGACAARESARSGGANPSVETLLHAFLPHKFVDHTHAGAILSLVDQPDGEDICAELYHRRIGIVPYVMPGFALAKMAADVYRGRSAGRGPDPAQARHLHLRRNRARILRAYDRAGYACRGAASARTARRCSSARICRKRSRRSPWSRRSCAAPAACGTIRSKGRGGV